MNHLARAILSLLCVAISGVARAGVFPPRATNNAPGGREFARQIESLEFSAREAAIYAQVSAGNVPDFLRTFCPVTVTNVAPGRTNVLTLLVAPDYLAVGNDRDYFLTPLSPSTAQRLADQLDCVLPTPKLVDEIWRAATVKLSPSPMTPGADMVTVRQFVAHDSIIHTQRQEFAASCPLGNLVAGHKKDVVITARLTTATNKVAIYGWHKLDGRAIQPLYLGHTAAWVDYSHGIRLVKRDVVVNGETRKLAEVLADPDLAELISNEGVVHVPRYPQPLSDTDRSQSSIRAGRGKGATSAVRFSDFKAGGSFGEQVLAFDFEPEVRVLVNAPPPEDFACGKKVRLIYYALPNGNTIEQTIGKKLQPGDDWHYNIQHIGAQTRWLRQRLTNEIVVVAYLEAAMKSWPAWRQKHGDQAIPELLATVKDVFRTNQVEVVLTGHSGGGSLTFGYINTVERIPDEVARIAFLDSNYAYRTTNHFEKLAQWLKPPRTNVLCVLAYQDYLGLLDGKPFVSEAGGTWGRSREMLGDLSSVFAFADTTLPDGLRCSKALNGRITFLLKSNPDRKVLHTVQVERNGFLHSELIATEFEARGYQYFGDRVYDEWIE